MARAPSTEDLATGRGRLGDASPKAVQHALNEGSKRVTQIDEWTRQQLRKRVSEAVEKGMSPAEAGAYVRAWSGFDEYRAERIARTELMFSFNASAAVTYGEYGVQQVVADDGDEDPECAERHGQVFTVDEALGIEDHPNGTLDWLPVAPDVSTASLQRALQEQRPFDESKIAAAPEPPVPPTPPTPPEPPPVPDLPDVSVPSDVAQRQIAGFQDETVARAHRTHDAPWGGGGYGQGKVAIVENDGMGFEQVMSFDGALSGSDVDYLRDRLGPGRTLVTMEPSELTIVPGFDDLDLALRTGANVRRFNVNGDWVEIRPRGVQAVPTPADVQAFHAGVVTQKRMGMDYFAAWTRQMEVMLQGKAEVLTGRFHVEAVAAAKEAASLAARLEQERLARLATSKWAKASKDDAVQALKDGKVTLEELAEQRWGWKGGTPGTDTAGKFVVKPGPRARTNPWTREHEVQFARAFEDAAERAGGYGRFEVDQVIFTTKTGGNASADYGKAMFHHEGSHPVRTSRIQIYRDTASELGSHRRADYASLTQEDDFYRVALHEIGHSLDYGSASQSQFDALWDLAKRRGSDSVGRMEKQITAAKQSLRYRQDEARRYLDEPVPPWSGRPWYTAEAHPVEWYTQERWVEHWRAFGHEAQTKVAAAQAHLDEVQRQYDAALAELRRLGQDGDRLMTEYAGKSGREAFAEAWVWYVQDPEALKERAPATYQFIRDVIAGSKRYRQ